jgi:hypothetical protein
MKNQNLYELSFGVNSDPILAQGQFSVLVLRLVPVMVPDVFAQNLQPMVQVSANQPQKWNWPQNWNRTTLVNIPTLWFL